MPPILFKLGEVNRNLRSDQRRGVPPSIFGFQPLIPSYLRIFGVTKDSGGVALGGCSVKLYQTVGDVYIDSTLSDGAGNYEFRTASLSTAYYVVAYKAGAPDLAGTTVNTIVGS
jgi:hypothetical protein